MEYFAFYSPLVGLAGWGLYNLWKIKTFKPYYIIRTYGDGSSKVFVYVDRSGFPLVYRTIEEYHKEIKRQSIASEERKELTDES